MSKLRTRKTRKSRSFSKSNVSRKYKKHQKHTLRRRKRRVGKKQRRHRRTQKRKQKGGVWGAATGFTKMPPPAPAGSPHGPLVGLLTRQEALLHERKKGKHPSESAQFQKAAQRLLQNLKSSHGPDEEFIDLENIPVLNRRGWSNAMSQ
jgi:hypothetical protein